MTIPTHLPVLIAEDERIARELASHIVRGLGYVPIAASGGPMALQIARDNRKLAAVLVDLVMPDLDGFELIEELRKLDGLQNTPIIVVTASIEDEGRERLEKMGVAAVLDKRLTIQKLRRAFAQVLGTQTTRPISILFASG